MKNLNFEKVWNDLIDVLEKHPIIHTLVRRKPNRVTSIDEDGIWVITERSTPDSHLVPKWMFREAIVHLMKHSELSNLTLLNTLNVKRSSFVLAALSKLDYIDYKTDPLRVILKI
jgi:hypothetical protein